MLTPAEKAAEARLADQRRDAEIFGRHVESVSLLRRRGYAVIADGEWFRVDGRRVDASALKAIAERQLRLMGVTRARGPGVGRRTPSGRTLAERLEYYSIPEPNSGCLLWLGSGTVDGYGQIRDLGPMRRAHRVSWRLAFGPIPDGLLVCHKCDVRACINPDHLFLGTHADNVADRDAKGRRIAPRGEESGLSKLTDAEVLAIRADGRRQIDIARDYGIRQTHVSAIKHGVAWRHLLPGDGAPKVERGNNCAYPEGEQSPSAKLTLKAVLSIRADQRRQVEIAAEHGITQGHVSRLKRGVGWRGAADGPSYRGPLFGREGTPAPRRQRKKAA